MHTLERYFTRDGNRRIFDGFAESLLRTMLAASQKVKTAPLNYDARAEIMLAASMSHNDVTGWRNLGDWACHQLEHELSGMFDVPHGAGLTAIWPAWARYVYKFDIARFAQLAVNVFGCYDNFRDPEATALAGISAFEKHFESLDMPTRIAQLGIAPTQTQIKEMAYKCSFNKTRKVGCIIPLDTSDMEKIYSMA